MPGNHSNTVYLLLPTLNYPTTHKDILRPIGVENCTHKHLGYTWFLSIKYRPLSSVASRILLIAEELLARERDAIPVSWVPRLGNGSAYQLPDFSLEESRHFLLVCRQDGYTIC